MPNIGLDLCNPKRIERVYKRFGAKFLKRVLTEKEIEQMKSDMKNFIHRLAARYAAKEAVAKSFGTGIGKKLSFQDMEILRNEAGAPIVHLNEKAQKLMQSLGYTEIKVSISHEDIVVGAVALAS